jgi:hypothetical protein
MILVNNLAIALPKAVMPIRDRFFVSTKKWFWNEGKNQQTT